MTKDELIAALEAAEGPSRELDQDIHHILGLCKVVEGACDDYRAPNYTASIDAALTLVPEGYDWDVSNMDNGRCRGFVMWERIPGEFVSRMGGSTSPAIALCIAGLRARP